MYSAIVCIVHTVHHMLIPKVDNLKIIPFCIVLTDISVVFNRPGVAGAVLHTASSLID